MIKLWRRFKIMWGFTKPRLFNPVSLEVGYVATWQQLRNKKLCRSQICRGFLALLFLRFARSTSPRHGMA